MDLIGWVGVGFGGTYGCRCGILYASMLGVVFYAGLVSLNAQRGWHTSELCTANLQESIKHILLHLFGC